MQTDVPAWEGEVRLENAVCRGPAERLDLLFRRVRGGVAKFELAGGREVGGGGLEGVGVGAIAKLGLEVAGRRG